MCAATRGRAVFGVAADFLQLVKNAKQDIVFPDPSEAIRDLAQPTVELPGGVGIELEDRQDFAEAARSHPCPVQRVDVPVFNPL